MFYFRIKIMDVLGRHIDYIFDKLLYKCVFIVLNIIITSKMFFNNTLCCIVKLCHKSYFITENYFTWFKIIYYLLFYRNLTKIGY